MSLHVLPHREGKAVEGDAREGQKGDQTAAAEQPGAIDPAILRDLTAEETLDEVFNHLDSDMSGGISARDLVLGCRQEMLAAGLAGSWVPSEEEITELVKVADGDGDGEVCEEEFWAVITGGDKLWRRLLMRIGVSQGVLSEISLLSQQ